MAAAKHTHNSGDGWLVNPVHTAEWDIVQYFCEKCGKQVSVSEPRPH